MTASWTFVVWGGIHGIILVVYRLFEAEEHHREGAVSSIFEFFLDRAYRGFFLLDNAVCTVEDFAIPALQDRRSLRPDGGREPGRPYVNNFFFFPSHLDGLRVLTEAKKRMV